MWNFAKDIVNGISSRVNLNSYSNFYIWITKDWESRLFWDHNVSRTSRQYICYQAVDESNARFVEEYFLKRWMKWWTWWWAWDGSAVFVYCYLITPYTRQ